MAHQGSQGQIAALAMLGESEPIGPVYGRNIIFWRAQ